MPRAITFELCLQVNHLSILLQKVLHNNSDTSVQERCSQCKQEAIFPLGMFSSITKIRSLVRKSLLSWTHFWGCCSIGIHSFIHFFQKESTRNWAICTVSLYEDPLGQTAPVVRQRFSFEAVGGFWSVVPGHLNRPVWDAHFQGSLSWFCGHFESFFLRSHSYGWWMEVGTSTGRMDTGNNESRPLLHICLGDLNIHNECHFHLLCRV